jgi:hypothetical protein
MKQGRDELNQKMCAPNLHAAMPPSTALPRCVPSVSVCVCVCARERERERERERKRGREQGKEGRVRAKERKAASNAHPIPC